MWHYRPYEPQYTFLAKETEQLAFISYEDTYENLMVRVATDEKIGELTNLVWILPVPALPEDVVIGHIESMKIKDKYYKKGVELSDKTKRNLKDKRWWFYNSQIWPVPFYFLQRQNNRHYNSNDMIAVGASKSFGEKIDYNEGIHVHETYTKYGLTSQLITADDGTSLYTFLSSKGLEMPYKVKQILNHYIGDDFCFVITEITDKNQFSGSAAVYTTFPAGNLYYPLVLTSVYESQRIPTKIYVDGYVNPRIASKIKQYTDVNYYVEGNVKPDIKSEDEDLFENAKFDKYTLITMDAPSKYLKKDLIMSKIPPLSTLGYNFVYEHIVLSCLFIFLLFSCLSSMIVAFLFKKDKKAYLKAGLFNVFSVIGYFVALNKFIKEKKTKEIKVISRKVFFSNCIVSCIAAAALLFVFAITIKEGIPPIYNMTTFLLFTSFYILPAAIIYSIWKTHTISTKLLKELAPDKLQKIKIGFIGEAMVFSVVFMIICLMFFALI